MTTIPRLKSIRQPGLFQPPGEPDRWVVSLVIRSILPQELPLLVSAGGFDLVDRFGTLSGEPFGRSSRQQVCLCRAAA